MCAQTLGGVRPLSYTHLAICMEEVAYNVKVSVDLKDAEEIEIVCPRFGSALAGGNWEFIKELINDSWVRRGLTVKVFYLTN
jgi:hypothetical protein